jgi:UDP-N-acetylmuramyl pentapeptide phosphotransferase/UDP-N-acetylglucosamine-1-phosphate transferase
LVVVLLVCVGFLEKRIFSETPIMAGTSWVLAVLIACFMLSGLPASGPMGILFIVVSLVLGVAGIVYYLSRRKRAN